MAGTMEIYANYGCLRAEKRTVYTYGRPADTSKCSDKITVKVPDGWELFETQSGEMVLQSPWGYCYNPNEVLAGDTVPIIRAYDSDMREYKAVLKILDTDKNYN